MTQKTSMYEKVSCIGAMAVSPRRGRVRLYFRLHRNANINTARILPFLSALLRQLRGNVVVVWDGCQTHRNHKVRRFLVRNRRMRLENFPPYAPELNPMEYVWGHSKKNRLANDPSFDTNRLAAKARVAGRSIQRDEGLMRSFIRASGLPLRLY